MLTINNKFEILINNFTDFYAKLAVNGRLIFYIIVILLFILAILFYIMLEQRNLNNKVIKKVSHAKDSVKKMEEELLSKPAPDEDYDLENEKTRNLKEITDKIQAVLDGHTIELTNFEKDQEESSIISYEELLKKANKKMEEPDKSLLKPLSHQVDKDEILIVDEPPVMESSKPKFKTSEVISPVFGLQNEKEENREKIITNLNPQTEVAVKQEQPKVSEDEQFLESLKNFRNNLN